MDVRLVRYTTDPVEAIDMAASVCYNSHPTKAGVLLDDCYKHGHHSVLEFAQFTFYITGISRACLAQLTRHRTASFAVRSQRYVKEDGFQFVTPNSITKDSKAVALYTKTMTVLNSVYCKLCEMNIPKEDARFVLPNACETVTMVSCDLRNLIHFMNERLCITAQWEIRELARKMRDCVIDVAPSLRVKLVPKCEAHSTPYCTESKRRSCNKHPQLEEMLKPEYTTRKE